MRKEVEESIKDGTCCLEKEHLGLRCELLRGHDGPHNYSLMKFRDFWIQFSKPLDKDRFKKKEETKL